MTNSNCPPSMSHALILFTDLLPPFQGKPCISASAFDCNPSPIFRTLTEPLIPISVHSSFRSLTPIKMLKSVLPQQNRTEITPLPSPRPFQPSHCSFPTSSKLTAALPWVLAITCIWIISISFPLLLISLPSLASTFLIVPCHPHVETPQHQLCPEHDRPSPSIMLFLPSNHSATSACRFILPVLWLQQGPFSPSSWTTETAQSRLSLKPVSAFQQPVVICTSHFLTGRCGSAVCAASPL